MFEIEVLDSTLRDGAQAEGISFSVNDRLAIVRALDRFGIPLIEAGNPSSNPKELAFFQQAASLKLSQARLCAFGSTCRKERSPAEDLNCAALLQASTPVVSIFGKSSLFHVTEILKTSPEENLRIIEETCRYLCDAGREVIFDAEHFFDGYALDPAYALESLRAAARGGARLLALCDTNGGAVPWQIQEIVARVVQEVFFPIGIHAHDDGGMATANSCAAVRAGVRHLQGTFLGFGERVGNANLSTILPNLQLKLGYACLPELTGLRDCAQEIASIANENLRGDLPFVGARAFAHKAGMHADGVRKVATSFEHIEPEAVGNRRRFLVSEVSGKAVVLPRVKKIFPERTPSSQQIETIVQRLKQREFEGYSYEGAEASFDLLIRDCLETRPHFFDLIHYKVYDQHPQQEEECATATLKIRVKESIQITAAEGDGPVNALDLALRSALREFYPQLEEMRLLDYKVRVMDSTIGTATKVRVLITSGDAHGVWVTVGVSRDILEASWEALTDSIIYFLQKNLEKE